MSSRTTSPKSNTPPSTPPLVSLSKKDELNKTATASQTKPSNERGLFIGDPLVDDLRSKKQAKVHDLHLMEASLESIESEIAVLLERKLKLIQNINSVKTETQTIDDSIQRCQQSLLVKWRNLSIRFGLHTEEGGVPSMISLLPLEVILNIFEYLSFEDIYFSVARVCKLWNRLSLSDVIWKNLFYLKWDTLDAHHQNESKPLKVIPASFWSSPILPPSQPPSHILPNTVIPVHSRPTTQYDDRTVVRKTPHSAILPTSGFNPYSSSSSSDSNNNNNNNNNNNSSSNDNESIKRKFKSIISDSESEQYILDEEDGDYFSVKSEKTSTTSNNESITDDMPPLLHHDHHSEEEDDSHTECSSNKIKKRIRIDWRELYMKRLKIEYNWWHCHCSSKKFPGHSDWITCMQFDGKILVTGSWDSSLKLWNMETGDWLLLSSQQMGGHQAGITCLQFKGNRLISGSSDSTLRIWDLSTGECLHILRGHTDGVSCLTLIDDNMIASGSLDNTINLWSIETGKLLHSFAKHVTGITCLFYKNNLLISGTMGGILNVIDLPSRIVLQTLHGHSDRITSIQWWESPSGEPAIISSSWDYTLRVWNLQTGKSIHVLSGHTFRVRCTFVRGNILVSGSWDTTVRVWDLLTGKCIHTLTGHSFNVWGVQFEGKRLVTAGWDRKVKVWDLESGKLQYTLDGHTESIICLQFKGSKLVTAAKEIIVWDFDQ